MTNIHSYFVRGYHDWSTQVGSQLISTVLIEDLNPKHCWNSIYIIFEETPARGWQQEILTFSYSADHSCAGWLWSLADVSLPSSGIRTNYNYTEAGLSSRVKRKQEDLNSSAESSKYRSSLTLLNKITSLQSWPITFYHKIKLSIHNRSYYSFN